MTTAAGDFHGAEQYVHDAEIIRHLDIEDSVTEVSEMRDESGLLPFTWWLPNSWLCDTVDRSEIAVLTVANDDEIGEATFAETTLRQWISSFPESSPTLNLLDQLRALEWTPADNRWPWTTWPTSRAFRDADTFIRALPLHEIPSPIVSIADDGEVNFSWRGDGVYVDLGFYGTGYFSYFVRGADGSHHHDDDVLASEGMPSEVIKLFSA